MSKQDSELVAKKLSIGSQEFVIRAYSALGFLSLGIFGALHMFGDGNTRVGLLELAGSAVILLNYLLTVGFAKRFGLAKNIFILTILLFMVLMLTSGGIHNTGIYWLFAFPIAAFFLGGKRGGAWWMAALFVATILVWAVSYAGAFKIPYDTTTIRQLLLSLLVVSGGIYAYQYSREQLEDERRASEEQLRDEKIRAGSIVQNINEGIITTDKEGHVTFMNHTAERILGWPLGDLKGRRFVEVIPMIDEAGHSVPIENRPLYRSLKEGSSVTTNARYRTKDGRIIPVSVTGTSIDVDGKITGGIVTLRLES